MAEIPLDILERTYRVLQYYSNETTYQGQRTGGVLQGCPRGPAPTPTELTFEASIMLKTLKAAYQQANPSVNQGGDAK